MSSPIERMRAALLELGLEDWIPVPESLATPEVREAVVPGSDPATSVGEALASLVRDGQVRLFRGRWDDDDPAPVPAAKALRLLEEPRWYSFHTDDPNEERLYFVNVRNIQEP